MSTNAHDFHEVKEHELSREDLNLIMGIAGPLYKESKLVESMVQNNPVHNGSIDDGSSKIRRGLENIQNTIIRASAPQQPQYNPQYIQPAPQMPQMPSEGFSGPMFTPSMEEVMRAVQTPVVPIPDPVTTAVPSPQLEFNFDPDKQDQTIQLLEKISNQLTKVIFLLESNDEQRKKDKAGRGNA